LRLAAATVLTVLTLGGCGATAPARAPVGLSTAGSTSASATAARLRAAADRLGPEHDGARLATRVGARLTLSLPESGQWGEPVVSGGIDVSEQLSDAPTGLTTWDVRPRSGGTATIRVTPAASCTPPATCVAGRPFTLTLEVAAR
jgi:hypothetical protein